MFKFFKKKPKLGPAAQVLIDSMHIYPDDWELSYYTTNHLPSGLQLWTANSWMSMDTYPLGCGFTTHEKWAIAEAVKSLRERRDYNRYAHEREQVVQTLSQKEQSEEQK